MKRIGDFQRRRTGRSMTAMIVAVSALVATFLTFAGTAKALLPVCTVTFTGATSSDWDDASNWSPVRTPNASDSACIPSGKTALFSTGTANIAVLWVKTGGTLDISGGTLYATSTTTNSLLDSTVNLSGGIFGGPATVVITNGAQLKWSDGTLGTSSTTSGTIKVNLGGTLYQINTAGYVTIASPEVVDVFGTFSLDPAAVLNPDGSTALIHVESGGSLVRRDGPSAGAYVGVRLWNDSGGTVNSGSGGAGTSELRFDNPYGSQLGGFVASVDAPIAFDGGTWTFASPATVSGPIKVRGGNFNVAGGYTLDIPTRLDLVDGTVGGAGTLRVLSGGLLEWSAGTMSGTGTTTVSAGGTLNALGDVYLARPLVNAGTVLVTGSLAGDSNSSITNSGMFELRGSTNASTKTFTQTSTGTLKVRIAGTGSFDKLQVAGLATLAGTIATNTAYSPVLGNAFAVVTFASRSGVFATVAGDLSAPLIYREKDNATNVTLTVGNANDKCVVPRVKGKPLARAKRMITAAHCAVGTVKRAFSNTVRTNLVITQRPTPGTKLPWGSKVNLLVSRGKR